MFLALLSLLLHVYGPGEGEGGGYLVDLDVRELVEAHYVHIHEQSGNESLHRLSFWVISLPCADRLNGVMLTCTTPIANLALRSAKF